jgi:hypothetical protein
VEDVSRPAGAVPVGGGWWVGVDYRSSALAVAVVKCLAERHRVLVDTNYDLVLPAEELTSDVLRLARSALERDAG